MISAAIAVLPYSEENGQVAGTTTTNAMRYLLAVCTFQPFK
jgi:hypothetical protein